MTSIIPRVAVLLCLCLGSSLTGLAFAQGCTPAPAGSGNLPPCCSSADMHEGGTCVAPATQYQFTIYTFGFEKSDGTVVQFGHAQNFDAASVSAGGELGNFISGATLAPGAYVAVRPTISRDITVATRATTADGRACAGATTAPSTQLNGMAWPNCAAGQPDAAVPQCLSGGQLRIRESQLGTMNITASSGATINFTFEVNNGAICNFNPGTGPATSVGLGVFAIRLTKS